MHHEHQKQTENYRQQTKATNSSLTGAGATALFAGEAGMGKRDIHFGKLGGTSHHNFNYMKSKDHLAT